MANHKSAIKEHRQAIQRRDRNRAHRSKLRGQVKRLRKALTDGDADGAKGLLIPTLSLLDHTAKLGAINDQAASRTKSRLTKAMNRLAAGA